MLRRRPRRVGRGDVVVRLGRDPLERARRVHRRERGLAREHRRLAHLHVELRRQRDEPLGEDERAQLPEQVLRGREQRVRGGVGAAERLVHGVWRLGRVDAARGRGELGLGAVQRLLADALVHVERDRAPFLQRQAGRIGSRPNRVGAARVGQRPGVHERRVVLQRRDRGRVGRGELRPQRRVVQRGERLRHGRLEERQRARDVGLGDQGGRGVDRGDVRLAARQQRRNRALASDGRARPLGQRREVTREQPIDRVRRGAGVHRRRMPPALLGLVVENQLLERRAHDPDVDLFFVAQHFGVCAGWGRFVERVEFGQLAPRRGDPAREAGGAHVRQPPVLAVQPSLRRAGGLLAKEVLHVRRF